MIVLAPDINRVCAILRCCRCNMYGRCAFPSLFPREQSIKDAQSTIKLRFTDLLHRLISTVFQTQSHSILAEVKRLIIYAGHLIYLKLDIVGRSRSTYIGKMMRSTQKPLYNGWIYKLIKQYSSKQDYYTKNCLQGSC
jgi:hypothetical protein